MEQPISSPKLPAFPANLSKHWIETVSGRAIDFLTPDPAQITLEDIAHHLSRIARYVGATNRFYSVAEHSYILSKLVYPSLGIENIMSGADARPYRLWALLHDAHEFATGDIPGPLCSLLGDALRDVKRRLDFDILRALGVDNYPEIREIAVTVKSYDYAILKSEARILKGSTVSRWPIPENETRELDDSEVVALMMPFESQLVHGRGYAYFNYAERKFIERFHELTE